MTLVTSNYTIGNNMPLNHARILWDMKYGTVTAGGAGGDLAQNDYTFQKWNAGAGAVTWVVDFAANQSLDCVGIAAHNLATVGGQITVSTSTNGTTYTSRGVISPTDNSAIMFLFNNAGSPVSARYLRISLANSTAAAQIGIIRAGVALQMERPIFGGVSPLGLSETVQTDQAVSESGAWLGVSVRTVSMQSDMNFQHLSGAWYRTNFAPFAARLPQKPFFAAQNPLRMPESVGWCWTNTRPMPSNMGIRDLMAVSLPITGFVG